MRQSLVFLFCFCSSRVIPQCVLGQDYCATQYADRDRLQQWVDYDRVNHRDTLKFNETKLADAMKAWQACQLKEFGSVPKVTNMDDGELHTFSNGTCFKPRDFGKQINAEASVKIKRIFDSSAKYERRITSRLRNNPSPRFGTPIML